MIEHGLVSTIIPVRNRPVLVREAIDSVLAQTYRSIEVIVVDDGSSDDTRDVVSSMAAQSPVPIRLLQQPNPGRGPGAVRETGRLHARGEFIQYLDSDDLLMPRKFELQVASLRERPDAGISYGWTRDFRDGEPRSDTPCRWTARKFDELFPALLVDRWWCTATPLYRRSLTDRIGPWPDVRWGQDWVYDAIAGSMRTKLAHVADFVSEFRIHDGDRQTGKGDWNSPERLLCYWQYQSALYRYARIAGVEPGSPEMLHSSRVDFSLARLLGMVGSTEEARAAIEQGIAAAGPAASRDLVWYRRLAGVFGWQALGRISFELDRFRGGASAKTMKWSWS